MTDKIGVIVRGMTGLSNFSTLSTEELLTEMTGRNCEDVALDYNVEKCSTCGYWLESCEMIPDQQHPTCIHCCDLDEIEEVTL